MSTTAPTEGAVHTALGEEDDLESLFLLMENWNTPHCEADHKNSLAPPCTHVPVARFLSCIRHYILVCQSCVTYVNRSQKGGTNCADCKEPTRDCWSLHPLNLGE